LKFAKKAWPVMMGPAAAFVAPVTAAKALGMKTTGIAAGASLVAYGAMSLLAAPLAVPAAVAAGLGVIGYRAIKQDKAGKKKQGEEGEGKASGKEGGGGVPRNLKARESFYNDLFGAEAKVKGQKFDGVKYEDGRFVVGDENVTGDRIRSAHETVGEDRAGKGDKSAVSRYEYDRINSGMKAFPAEGAGVADVMGSDAAPEPEAVELAKVGATTEGPMPAAPDRGTPSSQAMEEEKPQSTEGSSAGGADAGKQEEGKTGKKKGKPAPPSTGKKKDGPSEKIAENIREDEEPPAEGESDAQAEDMRKEEERVRGLDEKKGGKKGGDNQA